MKNLLKNITAFSMILILLVSTLQFNVYKMECIMSGNIQISFSEFNDCNKNPLKKEQSSISKQCCNFHELNFDFDYNSNISAKSFGIFNSPILVEQSYTVANKLVSTINNVNLYTNLPPPSGYELIKLVQVFRI